ncbi:hypothetical protein [Qipengyuania soli]|uniref:Uncharacterized protein n=1 Tax=Qipengyuania soli TaxID=2782568 RepID=A0A7S8F5X0_9SPHN|nr:hypothetical protein [Qipengyuania soli]QPC99771.1 hypothetical protein IRL76_04265 [Qipengyuania soli]
MRHAKADDLDRIEPLLARLRTIEGLVERSRGTFYRKGRALLHFHEDKGSILADLKIDGVWHRYPATSSSECEALPEKIG